MTVQKLKEHGVYIGFCEIYGYVYQVAQTRYAYNKNGIQRIYSIDIISV